MTSFGREGGCLGVSDRYTVGLRNTGTRRGRGVHDFIVCNTLLLSGRRGSELTGSKKRESSAPSYVTPLHTNLWKMGSPTVSASIVD